MPFDSTDFVADRAVRPAGRSWRQALIRLFRRAAPPAVPGDVCLLRVLEEARGLIERREDWVQGRYETFGGERCAIGAVRAAAGLLGYRPAGAAAQALLAAIALERGYRSVEALNDHSPHAHVLAAFDAAIARARHAQF
jgi:hypothetical protein